jgi:hypothetical protein
MAGTPSACRVQHLRSFHSLFSSGCRSGRNWPQARGPAVARNARLWRDASGVAIVKGGGGSSCWKHASGVTTRQDVQNDTGGMDVVGQSLGAGGFDGVQAIGEHGPEDLDHLPVAAALSFELALHTAQGRWQIPVLERGPVAQCAGLARQDRDAIPRRNEFDSLRQFRLPPRLPARPPILTLGMGWIGGRAGRKGAGGGERSLSMTVGIMERIVDRL